MENKPTIREEFVDKEWQHWSSAQSKFVRLPDSCKVEIANHWLNKIKEVVGQEEEYKVQEDGEYHFGENMKTDGRNFERQRILKEFGIIK